MILLHILNAKVCYWYYELACVMTAELVLEPPTYHRPGSLVYIPKVHQYRVSYAEAMPYYIQYSTL